MTRCVGALVLGLLVANCSPPRSMPCIVHDPSIRLTAEPEMGRAPLTVKLKADAEGFFCTNCCYGQPPTHIAYYYWDLTSDGKTDQEGATLKEIQAIFDQPGDYYVRGSAEDTETTIVTHQIKITVLP